MTSFTSASLDCFSVLLSVVGRMVFHPASYFLDLKLIFLGYYSDISKTFNVKYECVSEKKMINLEIQGSEMGRSFKTTPEQHS